MKVTKKMLHKDLQAYFTIFSMIPVLFRHKFTVKLMNWLLSQSSGRNIEGLSCSEVYIPSTHDDYAIRTRIYKPSNHKGRLPVMLYIHGGGYLTGNPEMFDNMIQRFIDTRPCVVVSPDYRKALTAPYPAAFNDCYDTLLWIKANAEELTIDADKFIVGGHSAGGGLAAAVTLKARDTQDIDIAFQMPFYPMIDDTQPDDPTRDMQAPGWNTKANRFGWKAYLKNLRKENIEIPSYAAPARAQNYEGLPPTITFVGTMDPFHGETLKYVAALKNAGVDTAFKEYPGCFHGFEEIASKKSIGKDGQSFTYDNYAAFYDKYIGSLAQ